MQTYLLKIKWLFYPQSERTSLMKGRPSLCSDLSEIDRDFVTSTLSTLPFKVKASEILKDTAFIRI